MSIFTHPSYAALLALTCVAVAGCSSSDDASRAHTSSPPASSVEAVSQYDLRTDVARVDAAAWDALVMPHEGRGLWLRPDARTALALDVGAVTVIKGRGVLKVASVRAEADHLVVEQGPVAFHDFIENGEISIEGRTTFDAPFSDFAGDVDLVSPPSDTTGTTGTKPASIGSTLVPLAGSEDKGPVTTGPTSGADRSLFDGAKDFLLDGWHVQKQSLATGDDSLRYDITMTKESGAFDAKIHVVGNVKNLGTRFKVAVHDHLTAQQTFDVKTSGDAELSWAVRINEGGTGYNKIIAPGLSYKQQFFVGEVPMVLKVKSSIGIILGASGASSITTGRAKISYSSDSGVHATSSEARGDGTADSDVAFDPDQGTLATGPAAFGFVAVLPKVDLGVGLDGLFVAGASFSNAVTSVVTARGAIALAPCANVTTKLTGKVGLVLEVTDSGAGQVISTGAQVAKNLLSRTVYEKERDDVTCNHP
jgi:hypothetical protein